MFPSSSFYDSSSWEADSGSRSSSPEGRHGHGHRRKGRRNGRDNSIGHGEGGRGGMSRFGYSRESGWATGTASGALLDFFFYSCFICAVVAARARVGVWAEPSSDVV